MCHSEKPRSELGPAGARTSSTIGAGIIPHVRPGSQARPTQRWGVPDRRCFALHPLRFHPTLLGTGVILLRWLCRQREGGCTVNSLLVRELSRADRTVYAGCRRNWRGMGTGTDRFTSRPLGGRSGVGHPICQGPCSPPMPWALSHAKRRLCAPRRRRCSGVQPFRVSHPMYGGFAGSCSCVRHAWAPHSAPRPPEAGR